MIGLPFPEKIICLNLKYSPEPGCNLVNKYIKGQGGRGSNITYLNFTDILYGSPRTQKEPKRKAIISISDHNLQSPALKNSFEKGVPFHGISIKFFSFKRETWFATTNWGFYFTINFTTLEIYFDRNQNLLHSLLRMR